MKFKTLWAGNLLTSDLHMNARPSKFIVVDPAVLGQSHLLVNTGFIELLSSLYAEVIVLAEATHCEALAAYLDRKADLHGIRFVPYTDKKKIFSELRVQLKTIDAYGVLFLNLNYKLFIRLNMWRLLRRKFNFYWVLHSHLTSLVRRGPLDRMKNTIKMFGMFDVFPGNRFIVCGDSIRSNFLKLSGKSGYADKIFSVFHPIGISSIETDPPRKLATPDTSEPVSVVFIQGWHPLSRAVEAGLSKLSELARARGIIKLDIMRNSFNQNANGKTFSRDYGDRMRQISRSDFFLHLPTDNYSLQASGALMDMVVAKMPVIGLKTEFAVELTEKIGEFGFFLNSVDDLVDFVATIDKDTLLSKKEQFQLNLRRGSQIIKEISARQLSLVGREFSPLTAPNR